MSFLINPYAFLAAGGDFESIATVTVGSGGASSIEFTSIPATFTHLQVRLLGKNDSGTYGNPRLRFNSDSGSNYATHELYGNGASASSAGAGSTQHIGVIQVPSTTYANIFGSAVIDILDYANTSKNKTARIVGGYDRNGFGYSFIDSGAWFNTAAITTVTLTLSAGNWAQYSTAALYGVKAP